MEVQIPTYLWLEGKVRELMARGIGVYVAQRGEKMSGLVLLKVSNLEGQCRVLMQQRDLEGVLNWINALSEEIVSEQEADSYIKRSLDRDPDLWVVEVEDKQMENVFIS